MLQAGKNILGLGDNLQKIRVDQLHHSLKNPKPDIQNTISHLRTLLTIDPKRYNLVKRKLPYVTCGIFNPPVRRTENFASIDVFILDVDHLSEKGFTVDQIKEKLVPDQRIELMFVSPGGDGLKILFRLSKKIYDHAKYSMFYKIFARAFSSQYGLSQVIDKVTSDVTRACFISVDPQAYFNPNPEKVNIAAFINLSVAATMDDKGVYKKSK